MNVEEIKMKGLEYANRFCADNYDFIEEDKLKYNCKEWYLIIDLAQIYYNLKTNIITREEAKEQQKKSFEFANRYYGE